MSEIDYVTPGVRRWMFKVAGGSQTTIAEFPFQSYLAKTSNDELVCGATILTSLVILTAAHCITGRSASSLKLVAGVSRRSSSSSSSAIAMPIAYFIPHELYNNTPEHDLALVVLQRPLNFTTSVSSIQYPRLPKSYAGMVAISGWGKVTETQAQFSDTLHYARLPIMPVEDCAKNYTHDGLAISDNFICALDNSGRNADSCQGDSGGPLTGKKGNLRLVLGVIVSGPSCDASVILAGVYINISRYGSWIMQNILQIGSDTMNCPAGKFYCQTANTCIPAFYVCDGDNDCGSTAEDEQNCAICQKGKFRCPTSGKCISATKWCDGNRDCPSGEDEGDCGNCSNAGYRCQRDKRCIPSWSKCNWHEDCDGGDDEKDCPPKALFVCSNGRKIPNHWTCDHENDCPGGEDERGSLCPYKCNKACRSHENNAYNEKVKSCCQAAGKKNGYCNPGDLAICH